MAAKGACYSRIAGKYFEDSQKKKTERLELGGPLPSSLETVTCWKRSSRFFKWQQHHIGRGWTSSRVLRVRGEQVTDHHRAPNIEFLVSLGKPSSLFSFLFLFLPFFFSAHSSWWSTRRGKGFCSLSRCLRGKRGLNLKQRWSKQALMKPLETASGKNRKKDRHDNNY